MGRRRRFVVDNIPVEVMSVGVDLDVFDEWIVKAGNPGGDIHKCRKNENYVNKLEHLERRLAWRAAIWGYLFTPREIEAMELEQWALSPQANGRRQVEGTQAYIAACMRITDRQVRRLLKSAEELMYYHQLANPEYVGWVNAGTPLKPKWKLEVPRKQEIIPTLQLVKSAREQLANVA